MRNILFLPAAIRLCAILWSVVGLMPDPSLARDPSIVNALAGRYSQHFRNGDVAGNVFWSDDVVEIVPGSNDAAYIRITLNFFNDHKCGIYGVGRVDRDRIVYRDPAEPLMQGDRPCVISLSRAGDILKIDDDGAPASSTLAASVDRSTVLGCDSGAGSRSATCRY